MANKYSQPIQTPYVQTYQPMNMQAMGSLMKDASAYRATTADMDARTEALIASVADNDPEAQDYIQAMEQLQKENISSREGESLAQRAIRAKTAGTRVASGVQQIQDAKDKLASWQEEMLEANKDIADQEELRYRMQKNRPSIEYDPENMRASVQTPAAQRLAPDYNFTKKANEYLSGMKDRNLTMTEDGQIMKRTVDPSGNVRFTRVKGVTADRVMNTLQNAFQSDPEAQAYLNRRAEYQTMQLDDMGENAGTNLLQGQLNTLPEEEKESLLTQIQVAREQGMTDNEIAGKLLANEEKASATGFGVGKFVHSIIDEDIRSISDSSLMKKGTSQGYFPSTILSNPEVIGMKKEVNLQGLLGSDYEGPASGQADNKIIGTGSFVMPLPKGDGSKNKQEFEEADINELLKSESARENYGHTLDSIAERYPKSDYPNMSNQEYIDTIINPAYQKKINALGNQVLHIKEMSPDERETMIEDIIGDKGANGNLGQFISAPMRVHTEEGVSDFMNLGELADKYDIDLSEHKSRKKLQERLDLVGMRKDNSAYMAKLYDSSGLFGRSNREVQIEIANTVQNSENSANQHAVNLLELQSSVSNKNKTFRMRDANNKIAELEGEAYDYYYDPETGEEVSPNHPNAQYQRGIRLTQKSDGKVFDSLENPDEYKRIIGILNGGAQRLR